MATLFHSTRVLTGPYIQRQRVPLCLCEPSRSTTGSKGRAWPARPAPAPQRRAPAAAAAASAAGDPAAAWAAQKELQKGINARLCAASSVAGVLAVLDEHALEEMGDICAITAFHRLAKVWRQLRAAPAGLRLKYPAAAACAEYPVAWRCQSWAQLQALHPAHLRSDRLPLHAPLQNASTPKAQAEARASPLLLPLVAYLEREGMQWSAMGIANVMWAHAALGHGSSALMKKVGGKCCLGLGGTAE